VRISLYLVGSSLQGLYLGYGDRAITRSGILMNFPSVCLLCMIPFVLGPVLPSVYSKNIYCFCAGR